MAAIGLVIASLARQSMPAARHGGLPRRYAPGKDDYLKKEYGNDGA